MINVLNVMMNQNTRKTSTNIVEVRGFITNFEKIQ